MDSNDEGSLYDPDDFHSPAKATRASRPKRGKPLISLEDVSDLWLETDGTPVQRKCDLVYDSDNSVFMEEQAVLEGDVADIPKPQVGIESEYVNFHSEFLANI
jgi:hypothetical protein